jgi:hypothetical protein
VPSLRPRPSLPPLGVPLLLLVVLAASVAGGWLLVGGSAGEASHELGAVTVHNTGLDAHRVEVEVRRGDAAGTGDTTGGAATETSPTTPPVTTSWSWSTRSSLPA